MKSAFLYICHTKHARRIRSDRILCDVKLGRACTSLRRENYLFSVDGLRALFDCWNIHFKPTVDPFDSHLFVVKRKEVRFEYWTITIETRWKISPIQYWNASIFITPSEIVPSTNAFVQSSLQNNSRTFYHHDIGFLCNPSVIYVFNLCSYKVDTFRVYYVRLLKVYESIFTYCNRLYCSSTRYVWV